MKAIGRPLASRKLVQVAMNLTDFEQTSMHQVFYALRAEADALNVPIVGTQIVGLVPRKAIERCEHFEEDLILEHRLETWQKN